MSARGAGLTRRDWLGSSAAWLGAGVVAAAGGLGCARQRPAREPRFAPRLLQAEQALLVEDLSELIVPATDTPGALQAGVPAFIESLLCDVFSEQRRDAFLAGLDALNQRARRGYGLPFSGCARPEQEALLAALVEAAASEPGAAAGEFFLSFRELVIVGFCGSEPGATRVLRYQGVPGRYCGCAPLDSVGRTWALP